MPADGHAGRITRSGHIMRYNLRTARVAAVLFVAATVASLIDRALLNPVLTASDYLTTIAADQTRVQLGALFQVTAGLTCAGIAITLYPVLRHHGEGLALGAVGFRLIEGLLYITGALGALMLLTLSGHAVGGASASVTTAGALLLELRDHASTCGIIAFYLGGTMYYYLFLRSRLIPRWLAGWGIAATVLGLTAALLVFFGVISAFSAPQIVLNLPIFTNELVLAGWLYVRGFHETATAPLDARAIHTGTPVRLGV